MITQNSIEEYSSREHFLTFDLGLATALVALGYELARLEKENPKKVQFIFRRTKNIDFTINSYWDGKLEIDARTLFEDLKMLKNRIYSA